MLQKRRRPRRGLGRAAKAFRFSCSQAAVAAAPAKKVSYAGRSVGLGLGFTENDVILIAEAVRRAHLF